MGAWDNAPEPEGPEVNFVSLKDGDKFIGRVESVELITIPAGTLPAQKDDLHDVPKVIYTGLDGTQYEFKYTTAVFRNGILRLKPEPGTWVFHHRIGQATGKSYVNAVIRLAQPGEYDGTRPAPVSTPQETRVPSTDSGLSAPAGPVGDDAPPF
jgi:hypothetical protein